MAQINILVTNIYLDSDVNGQDMCKMFYSDLYWINFLFASNICDSLFTANSKQLSFSECNSVESIEFVKDYFK